MWPTLRALAGKLTRKNLPRRRPAFFRPSLEVLEDRLAPATLLVNTNADVVHPADGTLSLRDAIAAVNAGNANGLTAGEQNQVTGTFGDNDTIQFAANLSGQTITLGGTALEISASVTITGPGASGLAISGNNQSQVFLVSGVGLQVSIVGLSVIDGYASKSSGGGILNADSTVTVSDCTLSGNKTDNYGSDSGGAIYNGGTLTVSNSTLLGNSTPTEGGAIESDGMLTVSNSTLEDNSATGDGGGIYSQGPLGVNNSTFTGNSAAGGGGVYSHDTLTVSNSLFTANTASVFGGGGVYSDYGTLTVSNSTVSDNSTSGYGGGGIYSGGSYAGLTLIVSDSTLSGNSTGGSGTGGGIYFGEDDGTLMVSNCALSSNSAGLGGGIYNYAFGGTQVVSNCTLSDNSAEFGGGIYNAYPSTTLTVDNSTLAGNSAELGDGGGIYNASGLRVVNSSLAGNSASSSNSAYGHGGGLANEGGSATLNNTIVAESTSGGDLYLPSGSISGGNDLIGDGSDLGNFTNSVQGNPLLAPLGNYGGPTQTMALLPGSPAIDAGSVALAVDAQGNPLTTDQRGAGFPRVVNGAVDIGAFESNGASLASLISQVLSPSYPVTVQANTTAAADTVISAVNQLPSYSTPVTVTVNLAAGTSYGDITASPPSGVTLVINGEGGTTTIVGSSPALTVSSGTVIVTGMTLTTATAAPTILVTGGSLQLRNDDIESSTGSTEACISLSGGSSVLDLGTPTDPGGNVFNINGTGAWFANATANPIAFSGDTFEINGAAQGPPSPSPSPWPTATTAGQARCDRLLRTTTCWAAATPSLSTSR